MRICNCGPLLKAIDRFIQKADDDLSDELAGEGYAEPKKTVKALGLLESEIAVALTQATTYYTKEIEACGSLDDAVKALETISMNDPSVALVKKAMRENLKKYMPVYVKYYLQKTDRELTLTQITKKTTAWIDDWSGELSELMRTSSRDILASMLKKELSNGGNIQQFCLDLMNSGMEKEGKGTYWTVFYRARRVAVTEILRAHSVSQQEAFMQSPAVTRKSWLHTGSYRNTPRENHVAMGGQSVAKGEPYVLIGADGMTYYPMYPRDPNLPAEESINCHCISQPVVDKEVLGLPLEERKRLQQQAIDEMDADWEAELNAQNKAKAGIED